MTPPLSVRYSTGAVADVEEIAAYIRSEGQPEAARRLVRGFRGLVEQLVEFPMSGRQVETGRRALPGLRVLKIPGFPVLVYHRVDREEIFIAAGLHGGRGPDRIRRAARAS